MSTGNRFLWRPSAVVVIPGGYSPASPPGAQDRPDGMNRPDMLLPGNDGSGRTRSKERPNTSRCNTANSADSHSIGPQPLVLGSTAQRSRPAAAQSATPTPCLSYIQSPTGLGTTYCPARPIPLPSTAKTTLGSARHHDKMRDASIFRKFSQTSASSHTLNRNSESDTDHMCAC
jgi:cell division septation protein DedD